jgi:cytochrome c oxidase subunit 3
MGLRISAKRDNLGMVKIAMIITTTFLGLGFLVGQWYSWVALVDMKVFLEVLIPILQVRFCM